MAYTVAARTGNVTVVGDASFMTAENYRAYDNEVFVGNLAEFLLGGERAEAPRPRPTPVDGPAPPTDGPGPPGNETTPAGNETETPGDGTVPVG
jgi:hypothetical protein